MLERLQSLELKLEASQKLQVPVPCASMGGGRCRALSNDHHEAPLSLLLAPSCSPAALLPPLLSPLPPRRA